MTHDLRRFMNAVALLEVYSENNSQLLKYLKDGEFDPYCCWWAVSRAISNNDEWREAMEEVLGKSFTEDELQEEQEPDVFHALPPDLQKEIGAYVVDYLMDNDPSSAPSTAFMSVNQKQLLNRQTWLVHFTNDPDDIASNGFTVGMSDMEKLGLTTYFKNSSFEKMYGGYNFAFTADSRYLNSAASKNKYGKHAVMFQNSGVHVWHYSDEEEQVIFWGADVQPRDIVVLSNNDAGWQVISRRTQKPLVTGDFSKIVPWVIQNFAQYHKAITGF